ncbi:MAG: class I SAM-dependent methyltransferase [Roseiflexaceae bacterium]|nr:class I SAM-dependent methyltransferase [Roseiflexaceae bacterium]
MDLIVGNWQLTLQRHPLARAALIQRYDRAAPRWHAMLARLGYLRAYADLFERLVAEHRLSAFGSAARILDCGLGTGALSLALAETVGPRFQLDGVDIASGMLAEARRHFQAAGISATLHQRSIQQLPFADNTFDAVMCAHVLEHVSDPATTLNEFMRVLRPGAPLLLIVTRPGLATARLRINWQATAYAPGVALALLDEAGFHERQLIPLSRGLPRCWSCAFLSYKPILHECESTLN